MAARKKSSVDRKSNRGLQLPGSHLHNVPVQFDELQPAVKQLFSGRLMQQMVAAPPEDYRVRLLSIEVVALAILSFIISPMESFLRLVDQIRAGGLPAVGVVNVSRAAFYKRLRKLPHTVFLELLRAATKQLGDNRGLRRDWVSSLAPFADGIYAIDDTTLDALMRKTKALKKVRKGSAETLGGRLGCALDLTTGAFAEVLFDSDSEANEKNHIRPLIERLGPGKMYVFDLGYFSFPFFDYLTNRFCYFATRLRKKTSYDVIHTLADGPHYRDQIVYLGKHRTDRASHPVRLVELLVEGTWHQYITNMLDPQLLPAEKLWTLYAQRWTIEKTFAVIKRTLGMAYLHPCHENGMLIQIWCTLTVYQVIQDLRLHLAAAQGWKEDDISWRNLMVRISWYAEKPYYWGLDLRSWLTTRAEDLALTKRGTRKRRPEGLSKAALKACKKPPPLPDPALIVSRTAAQKRHYETKDPKDLIIAGLS